MSRDELQTSFDFEESARSGGARAVAAAIAGHHADHPEAGGLVIVLSPETDDRQVLAGGAEGALRAAISSAVSSGHEEIWAPAPTDGSTVALDLRTLPDIVRAAVDGAGIVDIHVAAVERDDRIACCVLWLDQGTGAPIPADAAQVHQLLAAAVDRDRTRDAELAVANALAADDTEPAEPDADPMDAILGRDEFAARLDDFDGDEAVIAVVDIDDLDGIASAYDDDIAEQVAWETARRLTSNCRGTDLVARLGASGLGVLFAQANRAAAMTIVKRVHAQVSDPVDTDAGLLGITATVAFAHQDGLLDLEELLDSAESAVASSRRTGPGRLVLAS